jgi:SagB-type dehydrogenase family enzyme
MLHVDLATALCGINGLAEAKQSLAAALRISQSRRDLRGQAIDQIHLGALSVAKGEHDEALTRYRAAQELVCDVGDAALAAPVSEALKHLSSAPVPEESAPRSGDEIMVREDWTTEYGIEPDLLIDGPPELRIERWAGAQPPLAAYVCPELQPCTRIYMDERDGIHFALPGGEPVVERLAGCTVMRRKWSEVVVTMTPRLVWRVVQMMDGKTKVACILAELPEDDRTTVARLLAGLQAAGAIDISGRAVASFIHAATKKGTLPAGGLDSDEVMTLATDGNYRVYPEAARVPLTASIPEELESFHALTRKRRSQRDYLGLAVSRDELEAVLATACGVTGERNWAGRKTSLRAYPSSGGLYAVEIYPVALRVEGLDPAVFHFRPIENVLELVKPADPHAFIAAMLPMERALVANAAVLICLAANFPRHERKYGQGGYRMLIAEAGHISQNLILAATALGLAARPFGGVFDGLLNSELGLQAPDEEFLLSVVLGRAAVGDP